MSGAGAGNFKNGRLRQPWMSCIINLLGSIQYRIRMSLGLSAGASSLYGRDIAISFVDVAVLVTSLAILLIRDEILPFTIRQWIHMIKASHFLGSDHRTFSFLVMIFTDLVMVMGLTTLVVTFTVQVMRFTTQFFDIHQLGHNTFTFLVGHGITILVVAFYVLETLNYIWYWYLLQVKQ